MFGANGTGKTSLLEAIELFYCGKTLRNYKVSEQYKFTVLENGKAQTVSHTRAPQILRDRNLQWYGVREERSTKLYDGFGRFNFLNTDAAIEFSQSAEKKNINDDLAKLLVGADAARTWQVIEKLAKELEAELRGSKKLLTQVREEFALINDQLKKRNSVKKESDSLRSALHEAFRRNQWVFDDDLSSETANLIAKFAELKAVSERVVDLHWLDTPATLGIFERYILTVDSIIHEYAEPVENLKALQIKQRQLNDTVKRDQSAIFLVDEFKKLIKSGIEKRKTELEKHREAIATYSSLTAGADEEMLREVSDAKGNLAVGDYQSMAKADRKRKEEVFLVAKQEHADSVKQRDYTLSLAQELRGIAARILKERPSDECPLCHTKFKPGELAHHISEGVEGYLEEKAQKLLENVRRADDARKIAVEAEKVANILSSLCLRMKLPLETTLNDVIENLNKMKDALEDAQGKSEVLALELSAMEDQGLSLSRLNEVATRLSELGINLTDRTLVNITAAKNKIEERLSVSKNQMKINSEEEKKLCTLVSNAINVVGLSETEPIAAIAELKEKLAATRAVFTTLKRFLPKFCWSESRPIVEWSIEAEAVRGIATQLQTSLENERVEAQNQSDASQRRDKLKEQKEALVCRVNRLNKACEALKEIQTKHSLTAMTESALKENRKSIDAIFSQIHSPAEFEGIGPDWKLIRKLDNTKMPLTMVSTGQRAAFALSVFLAQNSQLKSGPQVILIDDPIAHVDDLNCLSFLDYLREIALTGTRQIFFATANSKLASLFERKFDFLGEKFRRIDLIR